MSSPSTPALVPLINAPTGSSDVSPATLRRYTRNLIQLIHNLAKLLNKCIQYPTLLRNQKVFLKPERTKVSSDFKYQCEHGNPFSKR